ncbi:MAG: metallophosphatase family protein, partial [Bacteroidia bacterium]
DYHDWDYVMTRPQDFAQIMNEYPQYTAVFLPALMSLIMEQTLNAHPGVKAVVQLGDLVEGVAGTPALAREMNRGAVDMLYAASLPVPWVLVKGNHDVSNSPGQPEAWDEVIRPFIEGQLGKRVGEGMYSFKISGHTELFILDQFFSTDRNLPESEMVEWLPGNWNNQRQNINSSLLTSL